MLHWLKLWILLTPTVSLPAVKVSFAAALSGSSSIITYLKPDCEKIAQRYFYSPASVYDSFTQPAPKHNPITHTMFAAPAHDTTIQLTFTSPAPLTSASGDTVYYNAQRPLQLSDFIAPAHYRGNSGAVSFSSFAYEGSSRLLHDTLQVHLFLQVFFVKSASWVLPEMANSQTLAHEQLHFDLTYLVAVRFRQKILAASLPAGDYDSFIQYEYLESFREMNRVQDAYDDDTRHGINGWAQHAWAQKVVADLALAQQGLPVPALDGPS